MTQASVLFVCLGNICRSPLAEAALRAEAEQAGLDIVVDSAGTGDWHVGDAPDPRAQAVARRHGIDISGYRGRQAKPADFHRFTHIFALDSDNLANLRRIRPGDGTASLSLLMDLVPGREGSGVTDPYYGNDAGFDISWDDVTRAARAIVARLRTNP
ncbi:MULTISPECIES: low molecular weight protein-tyrosine-phosphatase [Sphingobium]|jgi:protein-tyrosine phosphatase|uniref:protein-tyrosine-phosphatase n=1 Tax=Sphingobium yanoikuyae TaxID=13690 RepID=A0A0J9CZQ1_SPHYA|nr:MULTISPECIES: low molecular weight protein-tyrosine-phosphatase [Sphingobium]ATP18142.1 phosphotyrosine protein phosphatase [Sphingobium yanoikuyae]KMW30522.1 phosphotyrosine protein phosphatase [Sphingobium yanoikuyae]PZU62744.1 MAG: low molecular weight phosphotyrosine protein phosphatase [Sphingobium sp.]TKV41054.1 phosphotyrosine protein phosphatase [Sphingobium sp. MP9-4]